jgi:hypothetical protein
MASLKKRRSKNQHSKKNHKNSTSRKPHFYKMKGCSKTRRSNKKYLGGKCGLCKLGMKGGDNSSYPPNAMPNTGENTGNLNFFINSQNPKHGGKKRRTQKGGADALVGSDWTGSPETWPGVNGQGNNIPLNTYKPDISRSMVATGASAPFKGGKRRRTHQKGGTLSNFIAQDVINLGRQVHTGLGNVYNGISGYQSAVSPLPWKQMPGVSNLSTIKAAYNY